MFTSPAVRLQNMSATNTKVTTKTQIKRLSLSWHETQTFDDDGESEGYSEIVKLNPHASVCARAAVHLVSIVARGKAGTRKTLPTVLLFTFVAVNRLFLTDSAM